MTFYIPYSQLLFSIQPHRSFSFTLLDHAGSIIGNRVLGQSGPGITRDSYCAGPDMAYSKQQPAFTCKTSKKYFRVQYSSSLPCLPLDSFHYYKHWQYFTGQWKGSTSYNQHLFRFLPSRPLKFFIHDVYVFQKGIPHLPTTRSTIRKSILAANNNRDELYRFIHYCTGPKAQRVLSPGIYFSNDYDHSLYRFYRWVLAS